MNATKTFSVYVNDDDQCECEHEVTVCAEFEHEHYGADADGNRGVDCLFLESYEIEEIDGKPYNDYDKSFRDQIEDAVSSSIDDIDFDV